jgi:hypothetical protein
MSFLPTHDRTIPRIHDILKKKSILLIVVFWFSFTAANTARYACWRPHSTTISEITAEQTCKSRVSKPAMMTHYKKKRSWQYRGGHMATRKTACVSFSKSEHSQRNSVTVHDLTHRPTRIWLILSSWRHSHINTKRVVCSLTQNQRSLNLVLSSDSGSHPNPTPHQCQIV